MAENSSHLSSCEIGHALSSEKHDVMLQQTVSISCISHMLADIS
jgi:hypothetical protein